MTCTCILGRASCAHACLLLLHLPIHHYSTSWESASRGGVFGRVRQQRTGQDAKRDEIGRLGDGGKEQDRKSDREYGSRAVVVQGAAMLGGGGGGGWWWLHMHMGWGVCAWRDGLGMRLPKVSA